MDYRFGSSARIIDTVSRLLDLAHSALICVANWVYLIDNYANTEAPKQITWYLAPLFAYTLVDSRIGPWMYVVVSTYPIRALSHSGDSDIGHDSSHCMLCLVTVNCVFLYL